MKKILNLVPVLALVVLTGCAGVKHGGAVGAPSPVPETTATLSAGGAGAVKDCPASVTVVSIPALRGVGYSWVRATYQGGDASVAPTWTISKGADILAYNEDAFVAHIMAPTGNYTVRATGPCGVYGETSIDHVITSPLAAR